MAEQEKCEHSHRKRFLRILGGVALALVAVGIITQFNDIRRYIKISSM
jgi:hypothetical protein